MVPYVVNHTEIRTVIQRFDSFPHGFRYGSCVFHTVFGVVFDVFGEMADGLADGFWVVAAVLPMSSAGPVSALRYAGSSRWQ